MALFESAGPPGYARPLHRAMDTSSPERRASRAESASEDLSDAADGVRRAPNPRRRSGGGCKRKDVRSTASAAAWLGRARAARLAEAAFLYFQPACRLLACAPSCPTQEPSYAVRLSELANAPLPNPLYRASNARR